MPLQIINSSSNTGMWSPKYDDSVVPSVVYSPSTESISSEFSDAGSMDELILSPSNPRSATLYSPQSRSIFNSYWSSPNAKKSFEDSCGKANTFDKNIGVDRKGDEGEEIQVKQDDLVHRLQALPLPLVDDSAETTANPSGSSGPTRCTIVATVAPTRPLVQAAPVSPKSPRGSLSRRQILPNPPPTPPLTSTPTHLPSKSLSSSLRGIPRPPLIDGNDRPQGRPWSSTSALIPKPGRSCLRKSRYSFSGKFDGSNGQKNNTEGVDHAPELSKSVSFHSQVSVFEFTVPEKTEDPNAPWVGWSKLFF